MIFITFATSSLERELFIFTVTRDILLEAMTRKNMMF